LGKMPMVEILEGPGSGKEAIERVFRRTIQSYAQERPRCGCFMVNSTIELAPHDPEVAQCVVASFERMRQALYCALSRAQEQGELRPQHDLEGLARFLTTTLQGLHVAAKAGTELVQLHEVARIALSILS